MSSTRQILNGTLINLSAHSIDQMINKLRGYKQQLDYDWKQVVEKDSSLLKSIYSQLSNFSFTQIQSLCLVLLDLYFNKQSYHAAKFINVLLMAISRTISNLLSEEADIISYCLFRFGVNSNDIEQTKLVNLQELNCKKLSYIVENNIDFDSLKWKENSLICFLSILQKSESSWEEIEEYQEFEKVLLADIFNSIFKFNLDEIFKLFCLFIHLDLGWEKIKLEELDKPLLEVINKNAEVIAANRNLRLLLKQIISYFNSELNLIELDSRVIKKLHAKDIADQLKIEISSTEDGPFLYELLSLQQIKLKPFLKEKNLLRLKNLSTAAIQIFEPENPEKKILVIAKDENNFRPPAGIKFTLYSTKYSTNKKKRVPSVALNLEKRK